MKMTRERITAEEAYYGRVWEHGKLYEFSASMPFGVQIAHIERDGDGAIPFKCVTVEGKFYHIAPGGTLIREIPYSNPTSIRVLVSDMDALRERVAALESENAALLKAGREMLEYVDHRAMHLSAKWMDKNFNDVNWQIEQWYVLFGDDSLGTS